MKRIKKKYDNLGNRYLEIPKNPEMQEKYLTFENAQDFVKNINLDVRTFAFVSGDFIFGDIIESLIVDKNFEVKDLVLSTLSLSQNNIDSLGLLLDTERVDSLTVIVSAYFFAHERTGLVPYMLKELDIDNKFQLVVCRTHTKIITFNTYCGRHIVIHGSANLRSSSNLEQIEIEDNKQKYDFIQELNNKLIDKYKTINKEVSKKDIVLFLNQNKNLEPNKVL